MHDSEYWPSNDSKCEPGSLYTLLLTEPEPEPHAYFLTHSLAD